MKWFPEFKNFPFKFKFFRPWGALYLALAVALALALSLVTPH